MLPAAEDVARGDQEHGPSYYRHCSPYFMVFRLIQSRYTNVFFCWTTLYPTAIPFDAPAPDAGKDLLVIMKLQRFRFKLHLIF